MSGSGDDEARDSASQIAACTRVRSTLLVGSLKTLRDRGHGERYRAQVPELYDRIMSIGAPAWIEMAAAQRHYTACDALGLSVDEILRIGAAVAPVQASGIDLVFRAARIGGATPWTALHNVGRYWARMYEGSGVLVKELGPKDAELEVVAQPLAQSNYWCVGLRGILQAIGGGLSKKAYVRELPGRTAESVKYGFAWV